VNRPGAASGFLIRKIATARILVSDRLSPRASAGKIYELLEFAKIFYIGSRIRSGPFRGRAGEGGALDPLHLHRRPTTLMTRARERERDREPLPFSISTVTDPSDLRISRDSGRARDVIVDAVSTSMRI